MTYIQWDSSQQLRLRCNIGQSFSLLFVTIIECVISLTMPGAQVGSTSIIYSVVHTPGGHAWPNDPTLTSSLRLCLTVTQHHNWCACSICRLDRLGDASDTTPAHETRRDISRPFFCDLSSCRMWDLFPSSGYVRYVSRVKRLEASSRNLVPRPIL